MDPRAAWCDLDRRPRMGEVLTFRPPWVRSPKYRCVTDRDVVEALPQLETALAALTARGAGTTLVISVEQHLYRSSRHALTGDGLRRLLAVILASGTIGGAVSGLILRVHRNQLGDDGANAVAEFLEALADIHAATSGGGGGVLVPAELHLSHNAVTTDGALAVLRGLAQVAAAADVPLRVKLRLEQNEIEGSTVLAALADPALAPLRPYRTSERLRPGQRPTLWIPGLHRQSMDVGTLGEALPARGEAGPNGGTASTTGPPAVYLVLDTNALLNALEGSMQVLRLVVREGGRFAWLAAFSRQVTH